MTNNTNVDSGERGLVPYLSAPAFCAFAIGTAIGWGSLVVTCSSYLTKAGIVGSVVGMFVGGAIMLAMGKCYLYLMKGYPEAGGSYAFVREQFGHDFGFLAAWFLILTYLAVFWANATSLPLFARYFFGDMFRFGFLYTVFGYDVYLGEALLVMAGIVLAAALCLASQRVVARAMVALIGVVVAGLTVCVVTALAGHAGTDFSFSPAFIPEGNVLGQILHIAYLSPWAFIGFESVSHYSEETGFSKTLLGRLLMGSIVVVTVLYVFVLALSVSAYPPEYGSWLEYVANRGELQGLKALPAFYAAEYYMGGTGVVVLAGVLLALVATSLLGNLVALSRLFFALSRDAILPARFGRLDGKGIPRAGILLAGGISLLVPFIGRTAIGWIVDVTTIGATVTYAFVSASAIRLAKSCSDKSELIAGYIGLATMLLFGLYLLVPTLFFAGTIEAESYFLFTVWSVLGILYFRFVLKHDEQKRYGSTIVVWIALLALILFTSLDWMNNVTQTATTDGITNVQEYYRTHARILERVEHEEAFIQAEVDLIQRTSTRTTMVFIGLFAAAIGILVNNYVLMRRRAKATEEELGIAKNMAYRDALTGVKSKHAYVEAEDDLSGRLASGGLSEFAIVVFDVNGLKFINDTYGHKAGDEYIRAASMLICRLYKHSPVFRIGGDEFVAILTGDDYDRRDDILAEHDQIVESHVGSNEVVISAGMSVYDASEHKSPHDVFEQADARMYARKEQLKSMGARTR